MVSNVNNGINNGNIGDTHNYGIQPRSLTPQVKAYIDSRLPVDKSQSIPFTVHNGEEPWKFANAIGEYLVSLGYKVELRGGGMIVAITDINGLLMRGADGVVISSQ